MGAPALRDDEKAVVITRLKQGEHSYQKIARELGRHPQTIATFAKSVASTAPLAEQHLLKNAMTLAQRIIEGADVDQAIRVLRDKHINVLGGEQKVAEEGAGRQQMIVMVGMGPQAPAMMPPTDLELQIVERKSLPEGS